MGLGMELSELVLDSPWLDTGDGDAPSGPGAIEVGVKLPLPPLPLPPPLGQPPPRCAS